MAKRLPVGVLVVVLLALTLVAALALWFVLRPKAPGSSTAGSSPGQSLPAKSDAPAGTDTGAAAAAQAGTQAAVGAQKQEAEPNDEVQAATPIETGTDISGRIDHDGDSDYYAFTVPPPEAEILVIQVSGLGGMNGDVALLGESENELDSRLLNDDIKVPEFVRMRVKPGKYYLRVRMAGGDATGREYKLYAGKPRRPPATPEEVLNAQLKALDFLVAHQKSDGSWGERYPQAYTGLCLMALLGSKCTSKDYTPAAAKAVAYLKSKYTPTSSFSNPAQAAESGGLLGSAEMYQHGVATLALIEAAVVLDDPRLESIAQDAIDLIVRAQNTEHKPASLGGPIALTSAGYGGWRYAPSDPDSDISVSGWQILALKAGVNAGLTIPDRALPAAARYLRSLRGAEDGSFAYNAPASRGDSCARAGIGVLGLQVSGFPHDAAIAAAVRFMQDFPPQWNFEARGNGYPFYYWYYAMRAMNLVGGEDWRIWKDWMCRFLVDHQTRDGWWSGSQEEEQLEVVYQTALGALMLEICCGHLPVYMAPVKRPAPGSITVAYEKGPARPTKNLEIILDASGSMATPLGKKTRWTTALDVLGTLLAKLPDDFNVGLRLYGHRESSRSPRTCTDSELVVPIGPLDRNAVMQAARAVKPRGETPLVYSVTQAPDDLKAVGGGRVIVITDGEESCGGDVVKAAAQLKASGQSIALDIVGFTLTGQKAQAQLSSWAQSTGGRFYAAATGEALGRALMIAAMEKFPYTIFDASGNQVAAGEAPSPREKLRPGTYKVVVNVADQQLTADGIQVGPGVDVVLKLVLKNDQFVLQR